MEDINSSPSHTVRMVRLLLYGNNDADVNDITIDLGLEFTEKVKQLFKEFPNIGKPMTSLPPDRDKFNHHINLMDENIRKQRLNRLSPMEKEELVRHGEPTGGVKRHSVRYTAYVPDSANQFRTSLGQISRNQGAAVGKLWLPGKSPLNTQQE